MSRAFCVTGCAGFIGSACANALQERYPDAYIIGIDDLSTGRIERIPAGVVHVPISITNASEVERIFAQWKPEWVFHFAALPRVAYSVECPVETTEVNVLGTVVLLEAARKYGVQRFLLSSTSAVYGKTTVLPTAESLPVVPASPYAAQKYAAEEFCRLYSRLHGLDTVCLRYFNVYAPGQRGSDPYSTVIAAWLEGMFFEKPLFIEGDGSQSRDFCYVDDVVRANIAAAEYGSEPLGGRALNIASGVSTSLKGIRALIEAECDAPLALAQRPGRLGDVPATLADITTASTVLGHLPSVSLEEGIRRTVEWFRVQASGTSSEMR